MSDEGRGKVLVTGFEPFGGESVNPALEAVRALPESVGNLEVVRCEVPVTYADAGRVVMEAASAIADLRAVVCVGQAAGRESVTVERVAINVDDANAPDNAGEERHDAPIRVDGPAAYLSTLPVRAMVEASCAAGIPTEISNSAGTYVCNHLMYCVLDELAQSGREVPAGFIHVPLLHEQAIQSKEMRGKSSMSRDDIVRALVACIGALA